MNLLDSCDEEKYLFRRQFILGDRFIPDLTTWNRCKVNGHLFLTAHPDLPVTQAEEANRSLTLLGYILDPLSPEKDNQAILNDILHACLQGQDVFKSTYPYGGRWVLIASSEDNEDKVELFHDPLGFRTVVFTTPDSSAGLWCASQPDILAQFLNIPLNPEAIEGHLETPEFQKALNPWWPADSTPFKDVKLLMPNHCLNLKTGDICRYWPLDNLEPLDLVEGVEKIAMTIKGQIRALANRYKLAAAMTAGQDSRVVLASTKEVAEEVFFYTFLSPTCSEKHIDLEISQRLLRKLRLNHHVIDCRVAKNDALKRVYSKNSKMIRDFFINNIEGLYNAYPEERITIAGLGGEVGRCKQRVPGVDESALSPEYILSRFKMASSPFLIKCIGSWLSNLPDNSNVSKFDLLYWEVIIGSPIGVVERDIIHDYFSPFNCRNIYMDMLRIEEKFRRPPDTTFINLLIANLWSETLVEPLNPHKSGGFNKVLQANRLTIKKLQNELEKINNTKMKKLQNKIKILSKNNKLAITTDKKLSHFEGLKLSSLHPKNWIKATIKNHSG